MNYIRPVLKNLLLAFVLLSIGFVLGKHSVRMTRQSPEASSAAITDAASPAVVVYYMHTTIRCVTCNTIESMARDLVEQRFARELADGVVQWQEVNFQKNDALAEQFGIVSSCVVVARVKDGAVSDFKRLDDVWTLVSSPDEFNAYIGNAVQSYLADDGTGGAS